MNHAFHIVFTGGGTAGHLFPGLAVAEKLGGRRPEVRITFAGSGKPLERRLVAAAGFEYLALPCRPIPRGIRGTVPFLVENFAGYLAARRFLREERVAAVVGLGGYASVPLGRAAARRRVPLVLLEQNAVAGRATRWLAGWASAVCLSMDEARQGIRCRCPIHVTGNPLRRGFLQADVQNRQLLILGGSGGARSLNDNVPRALYQIREQVAGWRILHQAGEAGAAATRELYRKLGLPADVLAFLDDVPGVLAGSAVAVCRAGGTTLAELAAAGLPAVLVPYPRAADDHQRRNADVYAAAGGALVLDERELPGRFDHHLAEAIGKLLSDPGRRKRMALGMRRLACPAAATKVAALVRAVADGLASRMAIPAAA